MNLAHLAQNVNPHPDFTDIPGNLTARAQSSSFFNLRL